jgi:putative transposase
VSKSPNPGWLRPTEVSGPARRIDGLDRSDQELRLVPRRGRLGNGSTPQVAQWRYAARSGRSNISSKAAINPDGGTVALHLRTDAASGKKRTLRLPGTEFIGRFLQDVLPCGFKRVRPYGLLSPARKKLGLAAARAALAVPPPQPAVIEPVSSCAA